MAEPLNKDEWLDQALAWVNSLPQHDPDRPISRQALRLLVFCAYHSASADGSGVLLQSRWVESFGGVHYFRHGKNGIAYLVAQERIFDSGGRYRTSIVYQLSTPQSAEPGCSSEQAKVRHPGAAVDTGESAAPGVSTEGPSAAEVLHPGDNTSTKEVEEGDDASASSSNGRPGLLDPALLQVWRGTWLSIAKHRPALDPLNIDHSNADLQQEYRRLSEGGWDAARLDIALPHLKAVKSSETGWFLANLRRLPDDPDEEPAVVEARVALLLWLELETKGWRDLQEGRDRREVLAEALSLFGLDLTERDRLMKLAEAHGYLTDDGRFTVAGKELVERIEDSDLDEDTDPVWGLIREVRANHLGARS